MQKDITKVKDIWNSETKSFYTFDSLANKCGITPSCRHESEYRTILASLPAGMTQTLLDGQANDDGLFSLNELYEVTPKDLTPKNVYRRLLSRKLQNFDFCCTVLTNAGIVCTDLEEDLVKLKRWWSYLFRSDLDNKTKQFQWKLSNRGLYTGAIFHELNPDVPNVCVLCQEEEETMSHIFTTCRFVIEFWRWVFLNFNFTTNLDNEFIYLNNFHEMSKLSFLLTILGKHTIWDFRNILRNNRHLQDIVTSLKMNFKYKVQSHLNLLYSRYKYRENLNGFQEYSSNNIIHVENGTIRITVQMSPRPTKL